jgi:hypothetical protein
VKFSKMNTPSRGPHTQGTQTRPQNDVESFERNHKAVKLLARILFRLSSLPFVWNLENLRVKAKREERREREENREVYI